MYKRLSDQRRAHLRSELPKKPVVQAAQVVVSSEDLHREIFNPSAVVRLLAYLQANVDQLSVNQELLTPARLSEAYFAGSPAAGALPTGGAVLQSVEGGHLVLIRFAEAHAAVLAFVSAGEPEVHFRDSARSGLCLPAWLASEAGVTDWVKSNVWVHSGFSGVYAGLHERVKDQVRLLAGEYVDLLLVGHGVGAALAEQGAVSVSLALRASSSAAAASAVPATIGSALVGVVAAAAASVSEAAASVAPAGPLPASQLFTPGSEPRRTVQLITFGAPRVGNRSFASLVQASSIWQRFVLSSDPVDGLPASGLSLRFWAPRYAQPDLLGEVLPFNVKSDAELRLEAAAQALVESAALAESAVVSAAADPAAPVAAPAPAPRVSLAGKWSALPVVQSARLRAARAAILNGTLTLSAAQGHLLSNYAAALAVRA